MRRGTRVSLHGTFFLALALCWPAAGLGAAPQPLPCGEALAETDSPGQAAPAPVSGRPGGPEYPALAVPKPQGKVSIVIDTEAPKLAVYNDGEHYHTFPIAVGRPEPYRVTPIGEWQIVRKDKGWGGGFGTRWLGLNVPWGIYGIHGTNKPWAIGTRASAGCIRMLNEHVERLYEWVDLGTPVTIRGKDPYVAFTRSMEAGMSGRDVVAAQLRLKEMGFFTGTAGGRFDADTEWAVRRLQGTYALPVDGRVAGDVLRVLGLER